MSFFSKKLILYVLGDCCYPALIKNEFLFLRHCPQGYACLRTGENPNFGFTNFDNFMWSMLTTFQLITLDYWENVYNIVSTDIFECNLNISICISSLM